MSVTATDYDTVFWDIGGVIVELASVREGYAAFVAELAAAHDLDPDAALQTWKSALGEYFRATDGTDYRPAREGYERATAALFGGDPPDNWERLFERATAETLRAEDGAIETVESLREAGVQQAIVSDIDTAEADDMLASFGIGGCFAHVTTSEALGVRKPDERMFRDAMEATGATPGETLMIGDRYSHDVVGAAEFGIGTVGYGEDAWGPRADYEIEDLRDLQDIVGTRR